MNTVSIVNIAKGVDSLLFCIIFLFLRKKIDRSICRRLYSVQGKYIHHYPHREWLISSPLLSMRIGSVFGIVESQVIIIEELFYMHERLEMGFNQMDVVIFNCQFIGSLNLGKCLN